MNILESAKTKQETRILTVKLLMLRNVQREESKACFNRVTSLLGEGGRLKLKYFSKN